MALQSRLGPAPTGGRSEPARGLDGNRQVDTAKAHVIIKLALSGRRRELQRCRDEPLDAFIGRLPQDAEPEAVKWHLTV